MKKVDLEELYQRWCSLIKLSGSKCRAEVSFEVIVVCYGLKHKKYHTLNHILDCLRQYDKVRQLATSPIALEFAIWFHDIVYDVDNHHEKSNERRSATFAKDFCVSFLNENLALLVEKLVLATEHSRKRNLSTIDEKLIVAIDLSSLGAKPAVFAKNNRHIREEYSHVPDEQFRKESVRILQNFLIQKPLFEIEYFYDKYEKHAQKNIRDQIATLKHRS